MTSVHQTRPSLLYTNASVGQRTSDLAHQNEDDIMTAETEEHGNLRKQRLVKSMSDETSPAQQQISSLMAQVFALVKACPAGRVTTYGWIGKALGYPRGARMIGWIMHETPEGVPAQRVINSKGELSGSWAFGTTRGRAATSAMLKKTNSEPSMKAAM